MYVRETGLSWSPQLELESTSRQVHVGYNHSTPFGDLYNTYAIQVERGNINVIVCGAFGDTLLTTLTLLVRDTCGYMLHCIKGHSGNKQAHCMLLRGFGNKAGTLYAHCMHIVSF